MSPQVVTLGESIGLLTPVERIPLSRHPHLRLGFGGAESNLAIGLARLGHSVQWTGRLGNDEIGDLISRELRAEGVAASVVRDPSPTGLMLKSYTAAGQVQVTYFRAASAGSHLSPGDLDERAIKEASVLHVTGITPALSPSAAAAVRAAVDIAREAGVPVSLDVNFRASLWSPEQAGLVLADLAKVAEFVFATSGEAALLVEADDPAGQARAIASLGPRQVVVKLGASGSVACLDGRVYTQTPVAVEAVDPVGAGDAFEAGFLSQVLLGASPEDRLRVGGLAGAMAVTAPGDWEGMPHLADLDSYGQAHEVRR